MKITICPDYDPGPRKPKRQYKIAGLKTRYTKYIKYYKPHKYTTKRNHTSTQ